MKVVALIAENVKKIKAIEIRPDGNMVPITGRNGQGKTSILDSLWWAITGQKNVQDEPIRKGALTAKIVLDIGELIITRSFRKNEKDETISTISVETAAGSTVRSPQTILDSLVGSLALDPLEFARADDKKQFDALKGFVAGYDFEMEAIKRKQIFDDRTAVNRKVTEAKALVDKIIIGADYAIVRVDEEAILAKLQSLSVKNEDTTKRSMRRKEIIEECRIARARAVEYTAEIEALQSRIDQIKEEITALTAKADAGEKRIAEAPPLPELLKTEDIMKELADAKTANQQFAAREERKSYEDSYIALATQADNMSAAIAEIDAAKKVAISKATMPVAGLSVGDGIVLFNGVPFKQSSDAEQLRVSIAIAMHANPKLRVIRVRDGSLLDEQSMKMLEQMAVDNDYQVWIERVDSSGKVGFVIEDGMLVTEVPPGARTVTPAPAKALSQPLPQPKPKATVNPLTPELNNKSFPDDII